MAFSRIISRCSITTLSRLSLYPSTYGVCAATIATSTPYPVPVPSDSHWIRNPLGKQHSSNRLLHTSQQEGTLEDLEANEFLSRFVWIMRKTLTQAYPECDKKTINEMLVVIVDKVVDTGAAGTVPFEEFSEDLWRTVLEVKKTVVQDMVKEKRKEKMKIFLQSDEVKEKYRFAGEIGIRGDMLRELRFKWAREKMQETMFHERLERQFKAYEASTESQDKGAMKIEDTEEHEGAHEEDYQETVSLPKRHGKINFKIYGLNLSDPKWTEVADKIHESGKDLWPQEPKPITGKCKLVTDNILSLKEEDDPTSLLGEWMELQQPSRIEWIAFLDRVREQNPHQYFKVCPFTLCFRFVCVLLWMCTSINNVCLALFTECLLDTSINNMCLALFTE